MKRKKSEKSAFTLIELLVVIAIIGLLATIVLVVLNSARAKARDSRRWSDMNEISKAMFLYYDSKNPNIFPDLPTNQNQIVAGDARLSPFLATVPIDPGSGNYFWKDRIAGASATCFCVYVQLEAGSGWAVANPNGVKKVTANPNSGNCCTQ